MSKIYQKTLADQINFEGLGLHSGLNSKIKILPGKVNQGIVFRRVDLKKNNIIEACFKNVKSARLCTTIENDYGAKVSTVEHLLAALYIAEIDNAIIEIDNEEVPIMDGSAKDFLNVLKKTKIINQDKPRNYLKITKKIELIEGSKRISIEPNNSFEVDFQLNYENKVIGKQRNKIDFQKDSLEQIIESRTFCLFEDIEKIKEIGLAKGGSLDNAVVVGKDKVLNDNGLRNQKEFVNHKILDLAGDFVLFGQRVLGKVVCYQGGHELTNNFLRKLFNSNNSFENLKNQEILVKKLPVSNRSIKIAVNA